MEKLLISFLVFCCGITAIAQVERCNYPVNHKLKATAQSNWKVEKVLSDYRSNEPTDLELESFLRKHEDVTTVIRLNGEGSDSDGLSIKKEKEICKQFGVKFIYSPMQKDYSKWARSLMTVMLKEKVLIHCHHGYDRTGFIVGYKMIKYHNYSFNQVRKMNGWDKYDTYSKKFYPVLRELDRNY